MESGMFTRLLEAQCPKSTLYVCTCLQYTSVHGRYVLVTVKAMRWLISICTCPIAFTACLTRSSVGWHVRPTKPTSRRHSMATRATVAPLATGVSLSPGPSAALSRPPNCLAAACCSTLNTSRSKTPTYLYTHERQDEKIPKQTIATQLPVCTGQVQNTRFTGKSTPTYTS